MPEKYGAQAEKDILDSAELSPPPKGDTALPPENQENIPSLAMLGKKKLIIPDQVVNHKRQQLN